MQANWSYPTTILFGIDRLNELGHCCDKLKIQHPLIVIDPGLANTDLLEHIQSFLKEHSLEFSVFTNIKSNPSGGQLIAGVNQCEQGAHDGIIAVGGGSSIDMGKGIALMHKQTIPWQALEDIGDNYLKANSKTILPVIAIPTTSGTGSEVGRATVILDDDVKRKIILFHPNILPKMVIADPCLTVSMPKSLTAYTGMDALSHNLEAYCAPNFHPFSEGIALEGMRLAFENLTLAYNEPQNLSARSHMLACSMLGATAFQKGLGAMHALSHALGALTDQHHGLLNAVLMPYVLEFNYSQVKGKLQRLAAFLQLPSPQASSIIEWIYALREQLDIPPHLGALGITDLLSEQVVRLALEDPSCASNPLPLDASNLHHLFRKALG